MLCTTVLTSGQRPEESTSMRTEGSPVCQGVCTCCLRSCIPHGRSCRISSRSRAPHQEAPFWRRQNDHRTSSGPQAWWSEQEPSEQNRECPRFNTFSCDTLTVQKLYVTFCASQRDKSHRSKDLFPNQLHVFHFTPLTSSRPHWTASSCSDCDVSLTDGHDYWISADSKRNLLDVCLHSSWLTNFSVLSFHLPWYPQVTHRCIHLQLNFRVPNFLSMVLPPLRPLHEYVIT